MRGDETALSGTQRIVEPDNQSLKRSPTSSGIDINPLGTPSRLGMVILLTRSLTMKNAIIIILAVVAVIQGLSALHTATSKKAAADNAAVARIEAALTK
jgi:hypothetical protein